MKGPVSHVQDIARSRRQPGDHLILATHLSFPQIAEQMSLSRHTVKAEVTSIYRKLGASSRNQAVTRARDLGLLDR